mgnify:FL=1
MAAAVRRIEVEGPPADSPAAGTGILLRKEEIALELCEGMIDLAAAFFNVSSKEMRRPGRSALEVSRVRQVAMYVAHVTLRLTMAEVGRGFGRDRKTVQYACHTVEDLREDREFDGIISQMERVATAMLGNRTTG